MAAGHYAVYRLKGPYEGITPAYARLFGEWSLGSGESIRGRSRTQFYSNTLMDTPFGNLMTDLCVPLREVMCG